MNPLTNMKNVKKLSEQELNFGMKTSWHDQYKHSAWVFVGGLPYDLTEGDIICVFSQYGEVVNINLVRDKGTGKPRGFCFICYEDQRSTNLAVDNFNGIKLLNRIIRVDHCEGYKAPKDDKMDEQSRQLHAEGCAPGSKFGNLPQLPSSSNSNGGLDKGVNLPPMESMLKIKREKPDSPENFTDKKEKKKKIKKTKDKIKKLFKKKKKVESSSSSSSEDSSSESEEEKSKKRKTTKKLKRRKGKDSDDSSSSIEDSDTEDNKTKRRKKTRKNSSSSSDDSDDEDRKRKRKKKARKNSSSSNDDSDEDDKKTKSKAGKPSSPESEANEKSGKSHGKSKPSLQKASKTEKPTKHLVLDRASKDDEQQFHTRSKDEKDLDKYKGNFLHKNERDRKLPGDGSREDFRRNETEWKSRNDKRDDQNRRDNRERRDDRNRKDDGGRKIVSDSNQQDSSRYDYERKRKDEHYRRNNDSGRRH